jgi:ABC-type nitrate/sulfonate/bicarbonate transport system ATPase subunit
VLLVTHDIDEAILVADRIVLMGGRRPIVREWQSTCRAAPTTRRRQPLRWTSSPPCGRAQRRFTSLRKDP